VALLELVDATKIFGGLRAVNKVSFQVRKGELLSLIGPNGAGKTTLFNMVTGFSPATNGNVFFNGERITRFRPDHIVKRGIGRTWQANVLFKERTCLNNVIMSHHLTLSQNPAGDLLNTTSARKRAMDVRERSLELLNFAGLGGCAESLAGELPHGHQRLLGIIMALSTEPELLLLDEPAAGLNPEETAQMMSLIRALQDEKGITIMLVEHNMRVVMGASDRIVVLSHGTKIAEGVPAEIAENKEVIEAYLGQNRTGREDDAGSQGHRC
jgi:branched-chain amino acid transport system ATP-binding protein